jgi:hypothetical protein
MLFLCHQRHGCLFTSHSLQRYLSKPGSACVLIVLYAAVEQFGAPQRLRRLDRLGYAHFRRWKLYGEEALARHPAVIWLHGDALTVEYQETPLAQYTIRLSTG